MALTNYTITDQLYQSEHTTVYRGYRNHDKQPLILKTLNSDFPSLQKLAQLHHQYEVIKDLKLSGSIQCYGLQHSDNTWWLLLEDIQGDSLRQLLATQVLDLTTFLQIARRLADSLGELQTHHLIHKDLKPANIIVNLATGQVKLTDFGISSKLSQDNQIPSNPNRLEGTLLYMSPEQTGRMNRALDYRTDFYSLGIVFYEMLVGHPPFQSEDAMELVHCHLAQLPLSPHHVKPEIPQAISNLVMKLLAKTAEARYQSAMGLKTDLQTCWHQLQSTGQIEEFICGQWDISENFQIPQRLYGREREIATLLGAFERIASPSPADQELTTATGVQIFRFRNSELLLVSGYSGIGKSMLIRELYKPITQKRGYFVTGKFDQFQRNIPYSAIVNAFADLLLQLLTESDSQLNQWREQIQTAVGVNGQVIIEVIPEIELIIGSQPPVPLLGPTETQNRFNTVFQNFIHLFCQPAHPLVLFLDDLQWADMASLNFLEQLMNDTDLHHLLVLGAYRDNEVHSAHPLLLTLDRLRANGVIINQMALGPLNLEHITHLISDTLHRDEPTVSPLATLVNHKTAGNPFFVNQFLKTLYQEHLLTFSFPTDAKPGGWQWNMTDIEKMDITDNVVALMIGKLKKLPTTTQQVLRLAACIGNRFDLRTLSLIHADGGLETNADTGQEALAGEASLAITAEDLLPALQDQLILPTSALELVNDETQTAQFFILHYKFLHDRVQQAAYALIAADQKPVIHLRIGRLLWINTPDLEKSEQLFEVVDHLNRGLKLITTPEERNSIIQLNLSAGRKAKAAAAYGPAVKYLQVGLELLAPTSWETQYLLTLNLYREAIESYYLNANFAQSQQLATIALGHARLLLEKVNIYEILLQSYVAQNHLQQALDTALIVLEMLHIALVEQPPTVLNIEALLQLPEMTTPDKLAAMRMLNFTISPAYTVAPTLIPQVAFTLVDLSINYGNSSYSAYGYSLYGLLLCSFLENIDAGHRFGRLAVQLLDKFAAKEFKAKVFTAINVAITPWQQHAKETLAPLQEAIRSGLDSGDREYACIATMHYCSYLFWLGNPLETVVQTHSKYLDLVKQAKQEYQQVYIKIWTQVALNLQNPEVEDPGRLTGVLFNEADFLPGLLASNYGMAIFAVYLAKTMLSYLFKDYATAITQGELADHYEQANAGVLVVPIHKFYYSLALLAQYPQSDAREQQRYLTQVTINQTKMQYWAAQAPMNFQHKYNLVAAEQARVLGQPLAAMELYEQAIQGAKEQGYLQEEAIAYELAAEFYLTRNLKQFAQTYLREAHYRYQQWGAVAKVEDLETRYPPWFINMNPQTSLEDHDLTITGPLVKSARVATLTSTATLKVTGEHHLDFATVMKASQTISEEIILTHLIKRFMHIVIENAGAQKGILILSRSSKIGEPNLNLAEQQFWIEAEAQVTLDSCQVTLPALPLEDSGTSLVPMTLINYVLRTQIPLVLNDATRSPLCAMEPYILQQQPHSVLTMPILYHGQLLGVLYLENNLLTDVFTVDRLTTLKLLTSQIAISIRNSFLYQENEQARQAAEAANRAKSTFLANMNHELRTPLNSIMGYTQILSRDSRLNSEQKAGVNVIYRSSEYLLTLLNDLLDLAQMQNENVVLYPTDFYFDKFLQDMVAIFRVRAELKGISFIYQPLSPLPRGLHGDDRRLRQILVNLLGNAVKFTQKGGVTFKVGCSNPCTSAKQPVKIRFQVEDTGIGMSAADLAKIFLPFQQAGDPRCRPEGTGIGLNLAKQLVRLLGGELQVESTLGIGSTFWLELEFSDVSKLFDSSELESTAIITGYQGPPRKILVIDDHQESRAIMMNFLRPLGFEIVEALDGQEGLNKAYAVRPDLIVTDLVMPVMDGFELLRCLRKIPEFLEVPIIAVSASILENDQPKLSKTGFYNAFLPKPVRAENLLELLRIHLGLHWIYGSYSPVVSVPEPNQTNLLAAEEESAAPLVVPSTEQLAKLQDLVMSGDLYGILDEVTQLEQAEERLVPFTTKIRQLAREYEIDKIEQLINQYV